MRIGRAIPFNGAVSDLFTNNLQTSGTIKSTVTQSAIDAAKALVNQLTDSTQKTALLANVQLAQSLLNITQL
ncbi:toxin Cry1Ac domain D-VI-related protein [Listeria grandensis]|uniref:toxin Cry1Ac domain D-VI-related protein n=1 Tax=Listeria grandensis TaxID=1494963 RepID=UPI0035E28F41